MKVLLLDDGTLFLEGLQNLLQSHGIEILRMPLDEAEMLPKARRLGPKVIMISIAGKARQNLKTICCLKAAVPESHIIAFADGEENLRKAAQCGAAGYLLTDIHFDGILRTLREIERGETPGKAVRTAKIR